MSYGDNLGVTVPVAVFTTSPTVVAPGYAVRFPITPTEVQSAPTSPGYVVELPITPTEVQSPPTSPGYVLEIPVANFTNSPAPSNLPGYAVRIGS